MISLLIEAALRSLLFGLVVAIGLRAFRVRNVVAQKAAWTFVLVAAFAMPLLRPSHRAVAPSARRREHSAASSSDDPPRRVAGEDSSP
jgi:hypothetical protein